MTIITHFPHIYCINLHRRPDRLEQFDQQAKATGFTYERLEAVDGVHLEEENDRRKAELGCKLSHLKAIKRAQRHGHESVLIMEDDAFITGDLSIIPETLPEGWEMFYLGVSHINPPEKINAGLVRVATGFTTHAYAIHASAYDVAIKAIEQTRAQIDVIYADHLHPRRNSYAVAPSIITQRISRSDIINSEANYTEKIK
jgi:hypothetical protein